jgi:hypothetical protein
VKPPRASDLEGAALEFFVRKLMGGLDDSPEVTFESWMDYSDDFGDGWCPVMATGPTPLVAAKRAFVALKRAGGDA